MGGKNIYLVTFRGCSFHSLFSLEPMNTVEATSGFSHPHSETSAKNVDQPTIDHFRVPSPSFESHSLFENANAEPLSPPSQSSTSALSASSAISTSSSHASSATPPLSVVVLTPEEQEPEKGNYF
jgi:hypothetical protein